jgi:hypothetical protein
MWDDVRTSRKLLNHREHRVRSKTSRLALMALLSALFTFLMPGCLRTAAPGGTAHIRLNQLGYESGPIRVYLMTETAQTGSTFTVKKSSGEQVFSGAVGSPGGTWGKYKVYPMDFIVPTAGDYALSVSGPHPASSSFRVDTAVKL